MPRAAMKDWLEPSVRSWEHDGTAWRVVLRWAEVEGFAECVGVELSPEAVPHVLRATTVRALPFGKLVQEARHARYEESWGPAIDAAAGTDAEAEVPPGVTREAQAWTDPPVRRQPQLDADHYAEVARVYSHAASRGVAPRKAVAETLHVSSPTASRWISEARQRGLLPPTTPGRARAAAPKFEVNQ